MKFKPLINDITIDIWYSWNFTSIENIVRKCNLNSNVGFEKIHIQ